MSRSLNGTRALITGGAGFIGSHIADLLLKAGARRIIIIDDFVRGSAGNLVEAKATERVELVDGDICDARLVEELVEGVDLIFHQAALRITHCAEEPQRAVSVMMNGTQNVLDAAVRQGVSKVLAASSASVYGEPSYLPMDEGHPFNNRTLYGAMKVANEQMLRSYHEMYGLDYVALRPFNVYGPRMDVHGAYTEVMIRWLDRLNRGDPPIIFGDGKQTMDFVYVEDVARAYVLAAESEISDEVFNVGCGAQTSLGQLCRLLCDAKGATDVEPVYEPARKVNGVTRRLAGISKARDLLGFEAETDLEAGLTALIPWHDALTGREMVAT